MKKIFSLILAVMLMLFTLAACDFGGGTDETPDAPSGDAPSGETPDEDNTPPTDDTPIETVCTHEGGEASCTKLAVCSLCGEEYGELATEAHKIAESWTQDSGKHYHACENGCGAKFDEAICDINIDCSNVGECPICGYVGTSVDPSNHSVSAEWSYEDGKHYHACENGCGVKFDEAKCNAVANCVSAGQCTVCGTVGEKLNPTNHKIASAWTSDNGVHYKACENGCGARINSGECDIAPTCVDTGKCSVCGDVGTELDPNGHAVAAEWSHEGANHYKTCSNGCGARFDEGACDIVATCADAGKCSVCGRLGDAPDSTKHDYDTEYSMDDNTHYIACKNGCGTKLSVEDHAFSVWTTVTNSTTTQRGTVERTCSICGHKITKESDALIMPVKDGANGIVVLVHDDGTWDTVTVADELYRKYGIVGDVAMQLNGGRVVNSGDRYDLDDDTIATNSILKWRTLFATNRWKLISHSMTHTWWGTYDITYDGSGNIASCTNLVEDMDLMAYEMIKSQALLRYYFPGQRVLTFAHPGFANPKNYIPGVSTAQGKYEAVFGPNAREMMADYYIAGRGGLGINMNVTNSQEHWESVASSYAALSDSNVWNYFPAYGLDDGNLSNCINKVNEAANNGQIAVFYIHKLTTNEANKNASNTMYSGNYEQILAAVSAQASKGKLWNTFYEDAILYLQEAQNAEVSMYTDESGNIYLNLTDNISRFMLDEDGNETDEQIYTYPLTVRVNVPESWAAVKIEQNGKVSYVATKTVDGVRVADANIVPDAGEAKVSEAALSDIPEEEEPAPVVGTDTKLEYDVTYDFENGIGDVIASTNSASGTSTYVEGDNNWLQISKYQGLKSGGTANWILYGGYLPTSAASMSVSFTMKIDKAMLEAGPEGNTWGNITGNKRLFNIIFNPSYLASPYILTVWRDVPDNDHGNEGTIWLSDCANSFAASTFNNLLQIELDTEYEIRIEMRMDGVNPFLAEIYVNGNKIAESTNAAKYTLGTVPTVECVKFEAQGRSVFDVYLDDISIKTTVPKGEVDVTVYEQNFDNKNASIGNGTAYEVKPSYGSPEDDGVIALNINKSPDYKQTCNWTLSGSAVTNAIGFKFSFDVYIDKASTQGSSSRLYQFWFANSSPYILTIELAADGSGYVLKDMANSNAAGTVALSDVISFNEWHTIELVVDLDGTFGAKAYVDGVTNGVVSANYGRDSDGDAIRTTVDKVRLYAQKASGANVYFDNFELTAQVKFS